MDADGFVNCSCGQRHWGLAGAAGVLAWREGMVLAQLRAPWSISGGLWGFPGGAIGWSETPITGALREAREEAGLAGARIWATTTLDHGPWSYTSVLAEAGPGQQARAMDRESSEITWLDWADFCSKDLHPAVADTLPLLGVLMGRSLILGDAAEELPGSVPPDGIPLEAIDDPATATIVEALAACPGGRTVNLYPDLGTASERFEPGGEAATGEEGYRYAISASAVDWELVNAR